METTVLTKMPSLLNKNGKAFVQYNKRVYYLGRYGAPEVDAAYAQAVAYYHGTGGLFLEGQRPRGGYCFHHKGVHEWYPGEVLLSDAARSVKVTQATIREWLEAQIDGLAIRYRKDGEQFIINSDDVTAYHGTVTRKRREAINSRMVHVGAVFGKVTVIERIRRGGKKKETRWLARCECGHESVKRAEHLKRHDMCKNCLKALQWKGVGHVPGLYFTALRKNADQRKKGIEIKVSDERIAALLEEQQFRCALSGVPIGFGPNRKGKADHLLWTASLDRKDSSRDYEEGNIQWVHKVVNKMKMALSDEEFIEWCRKVAEAQPNKLLAI